MDARWRAYYPLAAILLGTALLQGVLWARLPTVSADGIIFINIAKRLAAAPLETMRAQDQHPGYAALLLGTTRVLEAVGYDGDPQAWMVAGLIVSFVCGLASVAVVWLLARDLFDTTIANMAAIIFAVLPVPRALAVDAQSDVTHGFFYLLSAWLATTGLLNGSYRRLAGAGLAGGLAFWIRPEGLEVVLVALPFLVWQGFRLHWPWRRRALSLVAIGGTACMVAVPYMALAGKITSKQLQVFKAQPVPTYIERIAEGKLEAGDEADAIVAAPAPAPVQATVAATPTPPASAANPDPQEDGYSPKLVLSLVGLAFAAFINSICQGLKFVFIPWYLLGDVALYWRRPAGVQVAFLAMLGVAHVAILMAVYVFSGYIAHRHVLPLVGIAAPFAALGIWHTAEWISGLLKWRPVYLRTALFVVSCLAVLPYTLRHLNREFVPVIEATRWVTERLEPGGGIICNSPYVPFYGHRPVAELSPLAPTLNEALIKAPNARYDYVVLHVNAHAYQERWLAELLPHYRQVLEILDPHKYARPKKVLVLQVKEGPIRNAALQAR